MRSEQSYLIVMLTILATIFLIALNHNLSYPLQAHAQLNNTDNTISSNITSDVTTKVLSEQPVVLRGIVSYEDFNNVTLEAGKDPHGAPLLPNRDDGTIYTGIVTYTATKL